MKASIDGRRKASQTTRPKAYRGNISWVAGASAEEPLNPSAGSGGTGPGTVSKGGTSDCSSVLVRYLGCFRECTRTLTKGQPLCWRLPGEEALSPCAGVFDVAIPKQLRDSHTVKPVTW
jgi:hypothetical protein